MTERLSLSEALLLVALDDDRGSVISRASMALDYGIAGALIMELALKERVAVREKELGVLNRELTGDPLLDDVIQLITEKEERVKPVRHWVSIMPRKIKRIRHRVADRLVDAGILSREKRKILWVFPSVRYPTVNPLPELTVREKIRNSILSEESPDTNVVLMCGLIKSCDLLSEIFEKPYRKQAKRRIRKLSAEEPVSRAVGETVAAVQAAVTAAVAAAVVASTASSH